MSIISPLLLIKRVCSILKCAETAKYLSNLSLIVITFLLLLPSSYSQNDVGNIRGKLTDIKLNKTIANHPVTLNIHKAGDVTKQETSTDESGAYRFENLPIDAETHYTISTTYEDKEHIEKDLVLTTWVPNINVDINIGAVTDDASQIRITSYTIVVRVTSEAHAKDGALSIFEGVAVENQGTLPFQTTFNNKEVGLYLSLPKGNEMFQPGTPENLKVNSARDHALLTDPLPPGELRVIYEYILHANENSLDLSRPLRFHTDQITILVPVGINLAPQSKHFKTPEYDAISNVVYRVYPAAPEGGFSAGETVDLNLRIPKPKSNIGQMVFIAIAAALAGGFLAAAIFMLRRSHRSSAESDTSQDATFDSGWLRKLGDDDLEHARTTRLEFITLLDEMHEKQNISERVYTRLRREQTERLTEILDQCKERGINI